MQDTYKVALGPVLYGKIQPGDPYWTTFNGSFQNVELSQDYIAAELYEGKPITTWCEPQWRKTENYQCGQHLGLDFDTEDQRSSIPHLLKEPFISHYASIIYTTPSHTPSAPRARALFLLDTPIFQAANYTLAASALLWIFGTGDRQCKDAVRFFYGGKPGACDMEWLGNVLPLDLVKDLIARYKATGDAQRKRSHKVYEPREADEKQIMSALSRIDPWGVEYDDWLAILLALHHSLGERGFMLAESWADGKPGEVERKWRGFGNYSGAMVTLGTLFKIAKDHGWTWEKEKMN